MAQYITFLLLSGISKLLNAIDSSHIIIIFYIQMTATFSVNFPCLRFTALIFY